ncbi:MAG: hypothetical protein JW910_17745 [Anaerolineae bacterium]|nr:hypothetical protein [Anaerolineae bacterium]
MNTDTARTNAEVIHPAERAAHLLVAIGLLILASYFLRHQTTETGFFTAGFGGLEMFCLYGPLLFAMLPPLIRVLAGRRNPARPVEIVSYVFTGLGGLWLLMRFPFEFGHFADVLPAGLQFLLAWMTNDIAKIPLVLMVITAPFTAFSTARRYLAARR